MTNNDGFYFSEELGFKPITKKSPKKKGETNKDDKEKNKKQKDKGSKTKDGDC